MTEIKQSEEEIFAEYQQKMYRWEYAMEDVEQQLRKMREKENDSLDLNRDISYLFSDILREADEEEWEELDSLHDFISTEIRRVEDEYAQQQEALEKDKRRLEDLEEEYIQIRNEKLSKLR